MPSLDRTADTTVFALQFRHMAVRFVEAGVSGERANGGAEPTEAARADGAAAPLQRVRRGNGTDRIARGDGGAQRGDSLHRFGAKALPDFSVQRAPLFA